MKTIILPGGTAMDLVYCPPGEFMMGSPSNGSNGNNEIQHRVKLTKGFWMGKTEVTQKQWKGVMRNNPSQHKGDGLPVDNVTWIECQEFCHRAGLKLRLPTEAEWEYACRAGKREACAGDVKEMAWYIENSNGMTHLAGQKMANAWGIVDMHGNVSEWCADWYGDYPVCSGPDPVGPVSGENRVYRGGSWRNDAYYCRSACRNMDLPDSRGSDLGLRVCCSEGLSGAVVP